MAVTAQPSRPQAAMKFFQLGISCLLALTYVNSAQAQLAGRPIAQPYYDHPPSAREMACRPTPLAWDCIPEDDACEEGYCGSAPAHRPQGWYSIVEFAPLRYDARRDQPLARLGPTGADRLGTWDLARAFDAGGKFTLGRTIGCCYQLEGTYLGSYRWNDNLATTDSTANTQGGTGNLSSALSGFSNPGTAGLDFNNAASVTLGTSLHTGELNLRGWLDLPSGPFDVSTLIGARYVQVNEALNFRTVANRPLPAGAINDVTVMTRNPMFGPQIGIDAKFLVSRSFYWDFDLKGALLLGKQSQTSVYSNTVFNTAAEGNQTSFLVDLSLTANYQIRSNCSIRAGYQALFLDGVALGKDNLQTNNLLLRNGPGLLNHDSGVIYHGPVLGVIITQ